jgi:hypothetical protein
MCGCDDPSGAHDAATRWMEAGRHITHRDRTEPMLRHKGCHICIRKQSETTLLQLHHEFIGS